MGAESTNLFPTIGTVAEGTHNYVTKDDKDQLAKGAKPTEAENEEKSVEEIESLCLQCHEQGMTRLLLTSIPFFREIIVMSFRCEHCGWQNNEIQSAGTIRPEGSVYTAKILSPSDLNRQIVRSSTCEIAIPELELTLPATNRGQLTTVEGLLGDIYGDLSMDQPLRRVLDPEGSEKVQALLDKIKAVIGDQGEDENGGDTEGDKKQGSSANLEKPMSPITIRLDDPAGNSFIDFVDSMADPKWNMRTYQRTLQQNINLGLVDPDAAPVSTAGAGASGDTAQKGGPLQSDDGETAGAVGVVNGHKEAVPGPTPVTNDEIFVFPGPCSSCGHHINTHMKKVNIPYFKDILIMSTSCEHCGYRDNEVKSGSAISDKGKRITLKVQDQEDLSRDILKSDTAGLLIPEIDLALSHGTLGGRFTTVEGILTQVYEELSDKLLSVVTNAVSEAVEGGDSRTVEERKQFSEFLTDLKAVSCASRPFTLILDDPLANSYIQNLFAPDPDPNMMVEWYERTWEQNEELGLNDMKV